VQHLSRCIALRALERYPHHRDAKFPWAPKSASYHSLCLESASQNKDGQKVDIARQKEKAQALRAMHHGPRVLVLPNAFDAMSARIFEETGFRAIATASAGIAFSLGYPDGEVVSRHEMLEAVRRIACAVSVPVSADMESGFADDARGVADTVKAVIEAGAVGINLEDTIHHGGGGFYDISTAVERIKAAKEAAAAAGVPIVVNARTDGFLHGCGEPGALFDEAVRRANAYRDAGADCLYVIGHLDRDTIGALARRIRGPLNILATANTPPIEELKKLGVARVTVGPGPALATVTLLRRIARELYAEGTFTSLADAATYADVNAMMGRRPGSS
jgi:2-methylisocitrate lyase-like PEP mutase family enzyme